MFSLRLTPSAAITPRPRERYKIDLPAQMAECEANYLRLTKLLAQLNGDECRLLTRRGEREFLHLFRVIERSPYTLTLQLSQVSLIDTSSWLKMPRLTVRIYKDAQLAEVLAWQGHKRLRPRYDYPNQAMYQCDEKHQLNQFLGEWLMLCLEYGYSAASFDELLGG
jgi:uncharacterized protein